MLQHILHQLGWQSAQPTSRLAANRQPVEPYPSETRLLDYHEAFELRRAELGLWRGFF